MKRRPGRRGEQNRRRRLFLTSPLPLTPSGVFSRRQSPAPRLLGRTPGGVLRAPSPAPAPRAAGPGGPGGPAAATAQRKTFRKNKTRSLPNVTVPGAVAQDGQKAQPEETQEEEKRREAVLPPPLPWPRGRAPGGRLGERHEPRFFLSDAPVGAFRSCSLGPGGGRAPARFLSATAPLYKVESPSSAGF